MEKSVAPMVNAEIDWALKATNFAAVRPDAPAPITAILRRFSVSEVILRSKQVSEV